jgi:hypothetical protein
MAEEKKMDKRIEDELKEAVMKDIEERIKQGLVKKEDVVDPKTGKIDWGKVIIREIDLLMETLEKVT